MKHILTRWTAVLFLLLLALSGTRAAYAGNFVVTNTADSGAGSLRQAILDANSNSDASSIIFNVNVPAGTILELLPASAYPQINFPVAIDATSQNGYSGQPLVEIDGTSAGANADGFVIRAPNCLVRGLAIHRFVNNAINIAGAANTGTQVANCYIGTDARGGARGGNNNGIVLFDGVTGTLIGGGGGSGNVISGNKGNEIFIFGAGTNDNRLSANLIGTNPNATAVAGSGNAGNGVLIYGGAKNNVIDNSVISGNGSSGVILFDAGTSGNQITSSRIGTDFSGNAALGNGTNGIVLSDGASGNIIGPTTVPGGNIISGNGGSGILISEPGTDNNTVTGNYIGINGTASAALGNGGSGIEIFFGAANNDVQSNVLSGNGGSGIKIFDLGTDGNRVRDCYIGTNGSGNAPVPNGLNGVELFFGAKNNVIGGAGSGNVISGNARNGVQVFTNDTVNNQITGNRIGTAADNVNPLPNGQSGGGFGYGVIVFDGADNTVIGGAGALGNHIAFNPRDGVAVFDTTTTGVTIVGNSIEANGGLGINLAGGNEFANSVTANDAGDADAGPNDLQNYPVISNVSSSGGATQIQGSLNSTPNTTFALDFYRGGAADPSAYGEGAIYIGRTSVGTDISGNAAVSASFSGDFSSQGITVTATDPAGNTSEFSASSAAIPPIAIVTPANGAVQQSLPQINGLVNNSNNSVVLIDVVIMRASDGYFWNGTGWQPNETGIPASTSDDGNPNTWTVPVNVALPSGADLLPGGYQIKAVGYEDPNRGGTPRVALHTITISAGDTAAPTLTFTSPSANSTVTSLGSISGTAPDTGGSGLRNVQLLIFRYSDGTYWNGSAWVADLNSAILNATVDSAAQTWSYNNGPSGANLQNGPYRLFATAFDNAGNAASNAIITTVQQVDNAAPTLTFTSPSANSTVTSLGTISGTAPDTGGSGLRNVQLLIFRYSDGTYWNGSAWVADLNSAILNATVDSAAQTWSYNNGPSGANLQNGPYRLFATAFDNAGNAASNAIITTVDQPVTPSFTVSGHITASGGGNEAGVTVTLTDGSGNVVQTTINANGQYTFNGVSAGNVVVRPVSDTLVFSPALYFRTVSGNLSDLNFVAASR